MADQSDNDFWKALEDQPPDKRSVLPVPAPPPQKPPRQPNPSWAPPQQANQPPPVEPTTANSPPPPVTEHDLSATGPDVLDHDAVMLDSEEAVYEDLTAQAQAQAAFDPQQYAPLNRAEKLAVQEVAATKRRRTWIYGSVGVLILLFLIVHLSSGGSSSTPTSTSSKPIKIAPTQAVSVTSATTAPATNPQTGQPLPKFYVAHPIVPLNIAQLTHDSTLAQEEAGGTALPPTPSELARGQDLLNRAVLAIIADGHANALQKLTANSTAFAHLLEHYLGHPVVLASPQPGDIAVTLLPDGNAIVTTTAGQSLYTFLITVPIKEISPSQQGKYLN